MRWIGDQRQSLPPEPFDPKECDHSIWEACLLARIARFELTTIQFDYEHSIERNGFLEAQVRLKVISCGFQHESYIISTISLIQQHDDDRSQPAEPTTVNIVGAKGG